MMNRSRQMRGVFNIIPHQLGAKQYLASWNLQSLTQCKDLQIANHLIACKTLHIVIPNNLTQRKPLQMVIPQQLDTTQESPIAWGKTSWTSSIGHNTNRTGTSKLHSPNSLGQNSPAS